MGVPKFFRWISARYPCINVVIQDDQVPIIDHFFLDMNGILHTCSHPEGSPNSMPEDVIFQNIKNYTQYLVQLIRPRKTLFLAVDGVAPRAKMTQQRARRFQSAQEARKTKADAQKRGQATSVELFDPCVISPGTEFMERLHNVLKEFVKEQANQNEAWKHVDIILSGHDCPGEGEHKIREYMSFKRHQPDYCPNERYCIYGMDADLIFLGLTTHELNMCILRENVVKTKTCVAEQLPFCVTYLSVLREYIDCEFEALKNSLPFPYDLERIVDDWIFMAFLLGNDFIPHIPNLHIHAESLLVLWDTYHVVLPQLDGYLVEYGRLNLQRFHRYIEELSKFEQSWFEEREADHRWMRGKRGAQMARELATLGDGAGSTEQHQVNNTSKEPPSGSPDPKPRKSIENELSSLTALTSLFAADDLFHGEFLDETEELIAEGVISHIPSAQETKPQNDLIASQLVDADQLLSSSSSFEDDAELLSDEDELVYRMHRRDYYWTKLSIPVGSEEELKRRLMPLVTDYVRMLQWILSYYFLRVADWNFYYAYHYAPFACDLMLYTAQFANSQLGSSSDNEDLSWTKFDFDSQPVLPFVQQMMIMPADGAYIVPQVFRSLMTSSDSPLAPFFPETFATDINGKIASWEAVVLIPFIDETILLKAMEPLNKGLTAAEQKRNQHNSHLFYPACSPDPCGCPKISVVQFAHTYFREHALWTVAEMQEFYNRPERAISTDFPSLFRLPFTTALRHIPVHIFETPSKLQSLTLYVKRCKDLTGISMEQLANRLLGHPIRVRWPHCAVVMPVRIMNHSEVWELQDFNMSPVHPSVTRTKKSDRPIAKITRSVRGDPNLLLQDPLKQPTEVDWFLSRVEELRRFLKNRRAILLPDESTDGELVNNDSSPVLIFSRKLEGWSVKPSTPANSKHSGDPQFHLVPNFVRSRANNGNQLDLSAVTLGLGSSWSAAFHPGRARKTKRAIVVPAMRPEPAHGNCDGLDLDLLDLVVPGGLPPPALLTHVKADWNGDQCLSLLSVFHVGQLVFVQTPPHTGRVGEVVGVRVAHGSVTVRLYPQASSHPIDLAPLRKKLSETRASCYMPTSQLAASIGLHPAAVARLTGTVLVCTTNKDTTHDSQAVAVENTDQVDKAAAASEVNSCDKTSASKKNTQDRKYLWNIGLNLRRNKTRAQVLGWSRFCPDRSSWVFSNCTADYLLAYSNEFPKLWSLVEAQSENTRSGGPIICDLSRGELDAAVEFLEQSGCRSAAVVPADGSYLDCDFIKHIRTIVYPDVTDGGGETVRAGHVYQPLDRKAWQKSHAIHCAPESLFVPINGSRSLYPSSDGASHKFSMNNFCLLDRVTFCKSGQTVPIGLCGTVIGVTPNGLSQTVEVMFDKEFPGAVDIRGSGPCCAVLASTSLLKVVPEQIPPKPKPKPQSNSGCTSAPTNANTNNPTDRFPRSFVAQPNRANFEPPQQSRPWPKPKSRKRRSSKTPSANAPAADFEPTSQNHMTTDFKAEIEELNALLFAHKIHGPTSDAPALCTESIPSNWVDNTPAYSYDDLNTSETGFRQSSINCLPSPPELPLPPDSWAADASELQLQVDERLRTAALSTSEIDTTDKVGKKKKNKSCITSQQKKPMQKQFCSTENLSRRDRASPYPPPPVAVQGPDGFESFCGQPVFPAAPAGLFHPQGYPLRPAQWQPDPSGWEQPCFVSGFDPRQQLSFVAPRPSGNPPYLPQRPAADYLSYGERAGARVACGPRAIPTWSYPRQPHPSGYFGPGPPTQHLENGVPLQHQYYRDYYSDAYMYRPPYRNPCPAPSAPCPPGRPRFFPAPSPNFSGRAPQPTFKTPETPAGSGGPRAADAKKMFLPPQVKRSRPVAKQSKKKS
ncbi:5'-3' exoribonuclease 1 [Clonorchis sinensis]|uniref:5'-3' exoribonuclease 1 n=1 Tax=Clonorchis sinensis TaxID=79923 RepID=A0A8T1MHX3_CLOSI|nr:5'-3' exoribonuclease 1 [Clonorchis sinensis]